MHFRCLSPQTGTLSQETNMLIVWVLHSVDSSRNKTETCETRAVKISSKAAGELFSLLAHHHNSYLKHNKAAVFCAELLFYAFACREIQALKLLTEPVGQRNVRK